MRHKAFAVGAMKLSVGTRERDIGVRTQIRDLPEKSVRLAPIVGVLSRDKPGARQLQASIERWREPAMRLMEHQQACVAGGPPIQMKSSLLTMAAVIEDKKLEVAKGLRENRLDRGIEHIERRVVDRHHDADRGYYHVALHSRAHAAKATMVHSLWP